MTLREVLRHKQINSSVAHVRMNLFANLLFTLVPFIFLAPVMVTLAGIFLALISFAINSLHWRVYSPLNYIIGLSLAFFLRLSLTHGLFSGDFFALLFAFLALSKSMNLRTYGDGIIFLILVLSCNATILLMDPDESLTILIWCLIGLFWTIGNLLRLNLKNFSSAILIASLRSAALATLYTLPLLIFLFYIFAKFSHTPLYSGYHSDAYIGLSHDLQPGRVADLKADSSIAFRAKMDRKDFPLDEIYWRGQTLTKSRGLNWSSASRIMDEIPFAYFVPSNSGCLIHQNIFIQRTSLNHIVFAIDKPIYSSSRGTSPYTITSDICGNTIKYAEAGPRALLSDLIIEGGVSSKTRALALNLKKISATEEDFRRAVFRYFKDNHFQYSLQSAKLAQASTLDEFLFKSKTGYCEHFAAAFATLARIAKIPSRIITGFAGGKYNPYGNYWIISYSDAHAWVEIWEKSRGWVRVDPTAILSPDSIKAQSQFQWLEKTTLIIDAAFFWLRSLFSSRETLFSIDLINPNPLQLFLLVLALVSWLIVRKARLDYEVEVQKEFKRLSRVLDEKALPRGRSEGLENYRQRLVTWAQSQKKMEELSGPLSRIYEEFINWKYSPRRRTQYELRLLTKTMATVRRSLFFKSYFLNVTRTSR